MKNLFSKFPIIAVIALVMGIIVGCEDPNKEGPNNEQNGFSVELKEVGAGYIDLNVTASAEYEAAYSLGTSKRTITNPSILFASGKKVTVVPNETLRLTESLQETTTYYLYIIFYIR